MANQERVTEMQSAGVASDLLGLPLFLIDPEGAAKRVHSKWFWVVPVLVLGAIGIVVGLYMFPIAMHVAEIAPLPDGVSAEQQAKGMAIGRMIGNVFVWLSPLLSAAVWAIGAAILLGISTVTGVTARFMALFNLVSGCSIIQTLQAVATAVILHFKGDISTQAELKPAMGLDIFMPEGTNKFLVALGGSFSVFQIWWVVMMALIYAAAFRTSKGKAFMTVIPLWAITVLLAIGGAVFQR